MPYPRYSWMTSSAFRGATPNNLKKFVLLLKWAFEAIPQPLFVQQVDHTDAAALRLIGVGGADSTACSSNPSCSPLLLHGLVEQAVVGHRHVGRG